MELQFALGPSNELVSQDKSAEHQTEPHASRVTSELLLSPAMSLDEAARTVMAFHFERMTENEVGVLRDENPEALHDMRVATRTLRASLRDFRQAFPKRTVTVFDHELEWLAQLLGRIRDLDVFLNWLEGWARKARGTQKSLAQNVIQNRRQARASERAALIDALNSERYRNFKLEFGEFVQQRSDQRKQNGDSLAVVAASKIKKELKRVRRRGKNANLNHLRRLHRLRIECKRLRYTSEFYQTLFPKFPNKVIDRSRDIQDMLGVVHDTDIHIRFLTKLRCAEPDESPLSHTLSEMIDTLRDEQRVNYKKFRRIYRRVGSKKFRRQAIRKLAVA